MTVLHEINFKGNKDIERFMQMRGLTGEKLEGILKPSPFELSKFEQYFEEGADFLISSILNSKKFLIEGDPDTDGIKAGYQFYAFLKNLGCTVDFIIPEKRTHTLEESLVTKSKDFDVIIIVDRGSNCLEILDELIIKGKEVLLLDHHKFGEGDRSKLHFINSTTFHEGNKLSAGMLVTLFIDYVGEKLGSKGEGDYSVGVATLISDICDFSDETNRALLVKGFNSPFNPLVKSLTDNKILSVRNIGFIAAARINAMMRRDMTATAVSYFKNPDKNIIKQMDLARAYQRELIANIQPLKDLDFLSKTRILCFDDEKYRNYTGLIASKKLTNTSFVLVKGADGVLSGSFRGIKDDFNYREFLISKGFKASGHEQAFGITLQGKEELKKLIDVVEADFPTGDRPVDLEIDSLEELNAFDIEAIADFNQYCNLAFPPIRFKVNAQVKYNTFSPNFIRLVVDGVEMFTNVIRKDLIIYPLRRDDGVVDYYTF